MNLGRYQSPQVVRKLRDKVQGIKIIETLKKFVINTLVLRKERKVEMKKEVESRGKEGFMRSIYEIFGFTAVMSVTVLTVIGVLILSFVMNGFLTYFRDLGWLSLGLAGVMLGIGWYKPYKIWTLFVTFVGAFLLVITFGPLVIEGYSSRNLMDVNFRNGYWMTLKSTMVFVSYLTCGTALLTWLYLLSKGRRQNPLRNFPYVNMRLKQRMAKLVVRIKST